MTKFRWRKGYVSPFPRHHCAVDAMSQLAQGTAAFALDLADRARKTPRLPSSVLRPDDYLLNRDGGAYIANFDEMKLWAALAGVAVSHPIFFLRSERPTLTQFTRQHRTGRYLLLVEGYRHAVALIGGKVFGRYKPRSRVCRAFAITLTEAP